MGSDADEPEVAALKGAGADRERAFGDLFDRHRRHLTAGKRDARRDAEGGFPDATNESLVEQLEAQGTTPTDGAARNEVRARLLETLDTVDPDDRRVLALRHFEELSNVEAARELGIEPAAASKRYLRALRRLKVALDERGERGERAADPAGRS